MKEYEIDHDTLKDRGAPAIIDPKKLVDGSSVQYAHPLRIDGVHRWVLIGPWKQEGTGTPARFTLEDRVRVYSGAEVSMLRADPKLLEDAISMTFTLQTIRGEERREWSQVPLKIPYRYLVESAVVRTTSTGEVVWNLGLAGGWRLHMTLKDVDPRSQSGLLDVVIESSDGFTENAVLPGFAPVQMHGVGKAWLWPDPQDVGPAWKLFSLCVESPSTTRFMDVDSKGVVKRTTPDGELRIHNFTFEDRRRVIVELGPYGEQDLVFLAPTSDAAAGGGEGRRANVYIDLGTTTTYVVYQIDEQAAESLDMKREHASILRMNDPDWELDEIWVPEAIKPATDLDEPDQLRTGIIVRKAGGADLFRHVFLATPGALQREVDRKDLGVDENRLKWSFAEERRRDQDHFKTFVKLLLLWTASRLAHVAAEEVRRAKLENRPSAPLTTMVLHLSHPRKMLHEAAYRAAIRQVVEYVAEKTGLQFQIHGGDTWRDEGVLPYQAALAKLAGQEDLNDREHVKILVADLGGGTLDLAGYLWKRETNSSSVIFKQKPPDRRR